MKATIESLKVDVNQRLTQDVKKALVKILEDEFTNQTTLLQTSVELKKDEALEAYKKKVGFGKLRAKIDKAQAMLNGAFSDLARVGLDKDGSVGNEADTDEAYQPTVGAKAATKLSEMLEKIADALVQPRNQKNKLIARIWVANTYGEAMVILNQVLGNGVLPDIDVKDIKQLAYTPGK